MIYKNILIFLIMNLVFTPISSFCQLNTSNSNQKFSFKVTEILNDSSIAYEKNFKVDIYTDNESKLIQTIYHNVEFDLSEYIIDIDSSNLEDINFDGFDDLILFTAKGAAGRNIFFTVYLFDSLQNKFQYNEALSYVCNINVNQKDKTIEEFTFDGGDPNYTFTTYEFVNDSLLIKKIERQYYENDKNLIETSYYKYGKFLYKKTEDIKTKYK